VTNAASRPGAVSPLGEQRGLDGVGAMGCWGARMDDNYDGGDDNYPRVVMATGAVGYAEGRGRDRQK
jgi:hypothetical protein